MRTLACVARARSREAPSAANSALMQSSLEIRRLKQGITDMLSLPVPFQYFHLLSVMIIMNLALWAYSMGCSDSIFAPVVFFFSSLIFVGMMELSSELSDPFGQDEVDFPVQEWLQDGFPAGCNDAWQALATSARSQEAAAGRRSAACMAAP